MNLFVILSFVNSKQISNEIIKTILSWSTDQPKLVVAIDGIPGVGKSTILDLMEGKISALLLHMDNFLTPIDYRTKLLAKKPTPKEFQDGLFDYSDIREFIKLYKKGSKEEVTILTYKSGKRQIEKTYDLTKPILIIEGTYLFDTKYFENLWDKTIYLDGDENQIKQRRIQRTKQLMGKNYISEDDPKSFFNFGLKVYHDYQEKFQPKQKADLNLTVTSD